jgi:ABC-type dipeptide/oligopeptide/nickel transport system ATPase component
MSELVGIIGNSGSGKTTSFLHNESIGVKGLDPETNIIINVAGKPLPAKGWKKKYNTFEGKTGNYLSSSSSAKIVKALTFISEKRKEITSIVIDDSQYIMGFKFMEKALEKGFDKFNILAKDYFDVLNTARTLRDDLTVFILTHSDEIHRDFETTRKMKTLGRMLDQNITLEGLFGLLLYTHSEWDEKEEKGYYYFITNKTSSYPSKSPIGMFENIQIPNDLGFVLDKINEFKE